MPESFIWTPSQNPPISIWSTGVSICLLHACGVYSMLTNALPPCSISIYRHRHLKIFSGICRSLAITLFGCWLPQLSTFPTTHSNLRTGGLLEALRISSHQLLWRILLRLSATGQPRRGTQEAYRTESNHRTTPASVMRGCLLRGPLYVQRS
ncbi:hypothetical protein GGR52DRAFT_319791 [Hypoxylon sp. FL1284]|nr:hypothetical protein GGR52DRAFT_319791 [Hypoxylon sp. FL1284]